MTDFSVRPSRRRVLASAALAGVSASLIGSPAAASAGDDLALPEPVPPTGAHLVLLGTAAGPVPMHGRSGISSALVVDGRTYLVDVGHGAFDRFHRAGLDIDSLAGVFVTHLHSDHTADLFTLLSLRFGGVRALTRTVDVYGPGPAGALPEPYPAGRDVPTVAPARPTPGVAELIAGQIAANAYDLNIRIRDSGWPDIAERVRTHEIAVPDVGAGPLGDLAPPMEPFEVMRDERVTVSAILVPHPSVFPSFAFRFDTAHGSVVFSGDTAASPNVVTLARGARILVHEAIDMEFVRAQDLDEEELHHHEISHTDVTKVGAIAEEAGVPRLVLSHLAPGSPLLVSDARWHAKASSGYGGRVVVGRDLMRLPV